jgi:aryl-alcohol dehydrogenase-like predicted oxidoreductase
MVFESPSKPETPLGWHRILSPNAGVKVSPIALGGISLGNSWSELFGKNEDPFALLDTYFSMGGNFIDTANTYCSGESEQLIGEWMESRGNRDQMVIATKYTSGYKNHDESIKFHTNFAGNSAKSLHVSIRDSLKKLRTDYIDIFYVHWWDFATSVEEIMTHLHSYVMSHNILYLGASDLPAWVVVKANAYARSHGLTPFSVYEGRWNAAYRDMEAELIPMCEDQGMAIVPWAALGGGQLMSAAQRTEAAKTPGSRQAAYSQSAGDIAVCDAIEKISDKRKCSFQAVALAYLFAQSTYVFPIVGVQKVEHVKAMTDALRIKLSDEEVKEIQAAKSFRPQFPTDFHFQYTGGQDYSTKLTAANVQQYQMWAWFDAPERPTGYKPHVEGSDAEN